MNDFMYEGKPDSVCPFSAHIRRTNPRDDRVAGLSGKKHRVVRSTMPYGPPYQETVHDFEEGSKTYKERGLLGLFACVNLADQFEFVMKNWVMRGGFNGNLPVTSVDPMIGLQDFVRTRVRHIVFIRVLTDCTISDTPNRWSSQTDGGSDWSSACAILRSA